MADAKGAYVGGVPVQFKDAAARAMISDEYNSAETYAKGNLCIYNGKIYEAIKETTGTWDATAWEETTLAKVNSKLNGDIASLTDKMENVIEKENCSYFVMGKVCIAHFEGTISGVTAIDLGLPAPRGNGSITLRDSDDGNIAGFWLTDSGYIATYKATNYTSGHSYAGSFAYLLA